MPKPEENSLVWSNIVNEASTGYNHSSHRAAEEVGKIGSEAEKLRVGTYNLGQGGTKACAAVVGCREKNRAKKQSSPWH